MCPCNLYIAYQYGKAVEQDRLASLHPEKRLEKAPTLIGSRMRPHSISSLEERRTTGLRSFGVKGMLSLWRNLGKWRSQLAHLHRMAARSS